MCLIQYTPFVMQNLEEILKFHIKVNLIALDTTKKAPNYSDAFHYINLASISDPNIGNNLCE